MKSRILFLTVLFITLFTAVGCHRGGEADKLSPEDYLKVLDTKIHRHPKDDALLYSRAQVYMQLKRVNEAISDLTRAISINDKEVKYHKLIGDAYFANGDVEHSYKGFERVLELEPESSDAYLKLGEIAYYSRDYDRAMDNLGKVTAKDPQNRTALFMKSFIYKETGDTSNAIVLLRKVCNLYPDYVPAFEELGVIYSAHHDPLALEYFNTAVRLDDKNTSALYGIAMFYQDDNQPDKAEEAYKKILDINANHKEAWHNRGYIQMFTYGDYELAVDYLTHAIQCDSGFVEAWSNRGCAYELMGDNKRARDDYQAALGIDHTFQPAIDGMARVK